MARDSRNGGIHLRARLLARLESRGRILERLAAGRPLREVLEALVLAVEGLSRGMLGSVLLRSEDGARLRHGAAPSLPLPYWSAIEGFAVGPQAGCCGTAVHTGAPVIVEDIATHPYWKPWRGLALRHGLRACWSVPVFCSGGHVIGAFALYYGAPRSPSVSERRLIQVAAQLAGIAIEHSRSLPEIRRAAASYPPRPSVQLSQREVEVIRLIASGQPVKRVAAALRIASSTVYTHRAHIFAKLGLRTDVELASFARERLGASHS